MVLPSREKATEVTKPLCALCSALSSRDATVGRGASGQFQADDSGVSGRSPACQSLSVWSQEPETMLLPSGEKATEATMWLCALCFSAFNSKYAAISIEAVSFGLKSWRVSVCKHLHPRL